MPTGECRVVVARAYLYHQAPTGAPGVIMIVLGLLPLPLYLGLGLNTLLFGPQNLKSRLKVC